MQAKLITQLFRGDVGTEGGGWGVLCKLWVQTPSKALWFPWARNFTSIA